MLVSDLLAWVKFHETAAIGPIGDWYKPLERPVSSQFLKYSPRSGLLRAQSVLRGLGRVAAKKCTLRKIVSRFLAVWVVSSYGHLHCSAEVKRRMSIRMFPNVLSENINFS